MGKSLSATVNTCLHAGSGSSLPSVNALSVVRNKELVPCVVRFPPKNGCWQSALAVALAHSLQGTLGIVVFPNRQADQFENIVDEYHFTYHKNRMYYDLFPITGALTCHHLVTSD
jgi:hypothetical protein